MQVHIRGLRAALNQQRLRDGADKPLAVKDICGRDADAVRSDRTAGAKTEIVAGRQPLEESATIASRCRSVVGSASTRGTKGLNHATGVSPSAVRWVRQRTVSRYP